MTGGGRAQRWNKRDKSVCAGSCFADVNIFWLSHFQLVDGGEGAVPKEYLHFYTFSGMLASGKHTLSNE